MEYRRGAKDPDVGRIQELLNDARSTALFSKMYNERAFDNWTHLDIDNDFGEKTENAVKSFQKLRGITPVSGIVGNTTWNYLSSFTPAMMAPVNLNFNREFREGDSGPEVKEIQKLLNIARNNIPMSDRLEWEYIAEDGAFGPRTRSAVECFQKYIGLDKIYWGIVGPTTYGYLRNPSTLHLKYSLEVNKDDFLIQTLCDHFLKPISIELSSFFDDRNMKVIRKLNSNASTLKQSIINDANIWNQFLKSFYMKMISLRSYWDVGLKKTSENLQRWQTKILSKSDGKHTRKVKKYNSNIDNALSNKCKYYSKLKLDPQNITKHFKLRNGFAAVGKTFKYADVALAACPLFIDMMNISETYEWQAKWNRDFSKFIEAVIGLVIGVLVACIAGAFIPSAIVVFIIGVVVSIIVSALFEFLRRFTWFQDIEMKMGEMSSRIIKSLNEYNYSNAYIPDFMDPTKSAGFKWVLH